MEKIDTRKANSWNEFQEIIKEVRAKYPHYDLVTGEKIECPDKVLFRGQSNSKWALKTTLERAARGKTSVLEYLRIAGKWSTEIESFTDKNWNLMQYPKLMKASCVNDYIRPINFPNLEYHVYLRHHGFPSPLLDWTESPYIAAFFAFADLPKKDVKEVAIYCYIERKGHVKTGEGGSPKIDLTGKYIRTHKRHYVQKAHYTVATERNQKDNQNISCSHESVFERGDDEQDILIKIVLPISLRSDVLKKLDSYNISWQTLFQNEDALIKTMAMREFDFNGD